jgi:hypothetical protein
MPAALVALRSFGPRAERVLRGFLRDNSTLLAVGMAFGVLAYGYALVNPSLSLDEESAPTFGWLGVGNSWSIAIYRFGIVAFQAAFLPGADLPFLRPLLAIGLLVVTATVYARMLSTTRPARVFFVLVFVTVPTFAYAMAFSFMCVEFVLAMLLFVLGLRCFVIATDGARVEARPLIAAVALWAAAPSFYQDYGVVLTAALVLAFFRVAEGRSVGLARQATCFAGTLGASAVLYVLVAVSLAHAYGLPGVRYLQDYASPPRSLATLVRFARGLSHFYFTPEIYGSATLGIAVLALPILAASVVAPPRRRLALVGLAVMIPVAPFVYGIGALPPIRAASGLLFLLAGASAFAVARSGPSCAFFVKAGVVWLALYNCVVVNNIFRYKSLVWDADRLLTTQLTQRIYDVAPDVHVSPEVRVVFAGSYRQALEDQLPGLGSELWVGMFETWGRNIPVRRRRALSQLGVPSFQIGSQVDYDASRQQLDAMPAWPARDAVTRRGNLVLVKLGSVNGYDAH